jgi:hypothetical protein
LVKQAAHDSSDECSNHSSLNILINKYNNNNKKKVRMLELVDSANLSFADISRERSSRSSDKYLNDPSLTNKTNIAMNNIAILATLLCCYYRSFL